MDVSNLNPNSIDAFNSRFYHAWKAIKMNPCMSTEHYLVNWSVENLNLLLLEEHKPVSSPTFVLDSSKTAWHIELYPHALLNSFHSIDIYLYRSDHMGPSSVGLTYRFGVLEIEGEIMWLKENKIENFHQMTFVSTSVKEHEREILSQSMFEYSKVFSLVCEMYVIYTIPHYDENLLKPQDYDLINFSFDFSKLILGKESSDYSIKVPGRICRTHRSVLIARSRTIREEVTKNNSSSEIKFRDISVNNMARVLYFIYSGNLSLCLQEPPSIGFYECAQKLAVKDLSDLLAPKHLHLRSVLKTQHFSYTWSIRNFMKRCKARISTFQSSEFDSFNENAPKWCLIVILNQISDELSVLVKTSGETKALNSVLKISLINGNGEITNTQITTKFKKPYQEFGFERYLNNFSKRSVMMNLLSSDILRVHCELFFVVAHNTHEVHDITLNGPTNFLESCRNLSNDLTQLLETSDFSDVIVKTRDNTMFKVHKSILFARSRKFYSKFMYYNRGEHILDVYDVDPDLVHLMFKHAYSGILEPMPLDDMVRLHTAADLYVFRQLAAITLYHLASEINEKTFFRIYIEGRKLRDRYLEEKCVQFISENANSLMDYNRLEEYRSENVEIYNRVVIYLNEALRKKETG